MFKFFFLFAMRTLINRESRKSDKIQFSPRFFIQLVFAYFSTVSDENYIIQYYKNINRVHDLFYAYGKSRFEIGFGLFWDTLHLGIIPSYIKFLDYFKGNNYTGPGYCKRNRIRHSKTGILYTHIIIVLWINFKSFANYHK